MPLSALSLHFSSILFCLFAYLGATASLPPPPHPHPSLLPPPLPSLSLSSSSLSSLSQPPLTNNFNSSSRSALSSSSIPRRIKNKCASPLNRLLLCASSAPFCVPPFTNYPYAGWVLTSTPSSTLSASASGMEEARKESQRMCFDQSVKCANFAKLCPNALYHLFLRSHCALTCGYCGDETANRRGGGARTETKIWRIGEKDRRTEKNEKKTTMATKERNTTTDETTSNRTGTEENGEKVNTTMKPKTSGGNSAQVEDKCEDVGKNCAAMERMCGNIAQGDIMDTFCRKTCHLC